MSAVPLLAGLGAVTSLASSLSIVFLPVFTPSSQNLTPSPPPQLPLLSLTVGRREGEGVVGQLPPHWSSPPSPPSPPTLPPPPSLLGGARVETPSSPLTHPNSASETVSKSESAIRHIPCLRCNFATLPLHQKYPVIKWKRWKRRGETLVFTPHQFVCSARSLLLRCHYKQLHDPSNF